MHRPSNAARLSPRATRTRRATTRLSRAVQTHDPQQPIEINRLHQGGHGAQCDGALLGVDRTRHDGNRYVGDGGIAQLSAPEFLAAEPRLKVQQFYLRDIARRAAHTLTANEEKILADAGPLVGGASSVFNMLSNADFPYPTVTLSDGRSVKLDQADIVRHKLVQNIVSAYERSREND